MPTRTNNDILSKKRLLEMMTAFKTTYLLRAAIKLRVFDCLAAGPADPDDVAAMLKTDPRGTRILLRALAAAGLLEADGERFGLPEGTADLLVTTSPDYCGGIVHVAAGDSEWDAMRDLADTVRHGGTLLDTDAESPDFSYWVDFATHLTFATEPGADLVAETVLPWAADREALDVLDVGCGHGLFGLTLAARDSRATVTCLDWSDVLDVAATHAKRLEVQDRTHYLPGDAFEVDPGGPYDVIVLGNFLFQFSFRSGIELLRRLGSALKPGGGMVIVGFTTGDRSPAEEYHAHMLNLLMLSWTSQGELHSSAMYRKMLASAGLARTEEHERPGLPLPAWRSGSPAVRCRCGQRQSGKSRSGTAGRWSSGFSLRGRGRDRVRGTQPCGVEQLDGVRGAAVEREIGGGPEAPSQDRAHGNGEAARPLSSLRPLPHPIRHRKQPPSRASEDAFSRPSVCRAAARQIRDSELTRRRT